MVLIAGTLLYVGTDPPVIDKLIGLTHVVRHERVAHVLLVFRVHRAVYI